MSSNGLSNGNSNGVSNGHTNGVTNGQSPLITEVGQNKSKSVVGVADAVTEYMNKVFVPKTIHEMTSDYDAWRNYDEDVKVDGYNGPEYTAGVIRRVMNESKNIIDVCGGTGALVEHLRRGNFDSWRNIDAVDGSSQMLEQAQKKNIYRKTICEFIDPNGSQIETGSYDAAVSVGAISPNHLNETHLPEIIRYVKKGGLIVIGARERWVVGHLEESYQWPHNTEDGMYKLADEGVWELVSREQRQEYCSGYPGLIYVWRKL